MAFVFDYVSDVHINHHVLWIPNQQKWEKRTREWTRELLAGRNPEANVLFIAGDFSEWNTQAYWFIEECASVYDHVFYVTGNHDLYLLSKAQGDKYDKNSLNRLVELEEMTKQLPNVTYLKGQVVTYKGKKIAGHSLWYCPKTKEDWAFYKHISNDSRFITTPIEIEEQTWIAKSIPETLYEAAMAFYEAWEDEALDIIMTHVPPIHPDVPENAHKRNACYDADIEHLYAPHWICGHQHLQARFEQNGTKFYMNSIGYPDENTSVKLETAWID